MNEYLHIEKAACLVDKPGAEKLATRRAKKFVADALASGEKKEVSKSNNTFISRPIYVWAGIAFALAACVVVAVIIHPTVYGGIPGMLIEQQDIHSNTSVADTSIAETSDTLVVGSIIIPD